MLPADSCVGMSLTSGPILFEVLRNFRPAAFGGPLARGGATVAHLQIQVNQCVYSTAWVGERRRLQTRYRLLTSTEYVSPTH
jgi:hypothetical protein